MRRRRSRKGETFLYGIVGIATIIIAIGQFLLEHIWIVAIVVIIPLVIFVTVQLVKYFKKQTNNNLSTNNRPPPVKIDEDEIGEYTSRLDNAYHHIEQARKAEKNGDYFAARMNYLKCVEALKIAKATEELTKATSEYEAFVHRDPVFKKITEIFLTGIKENPGILQSDITKKFEDMEWADLYRSNRPIAKDDIRYILYFADKFGLIIRKKEGRSYRLYLPEQGK